MDRTKKPRSSNLASHRRFELLDLNKSSSSLNMSTSSLRSVGEDTRKGGGSVAVQARRATTVRFAPPPLSSAAKASSGPVSHSQSQQALAMARPGTASGARPGSASGTRCRTSAGRLPEPAGPKAMRRSWGWTGTAAELDAKEPAASGNPVVARVVAKTHSRSSSAPRRLPAEEKEKPLTKRGSSKIMPTSTSRTKTNQGTPPKTETQGSRSPVGVAAARTNMKAPNTNSVSPKNMDTVVVSPPPTKTSVATIGACWESLPSDLQNLGLVTLYSDSCSAFAHKIVRLADKEVMRYRDDAEAAAVEALRQSSAAEILLRCLSAFADLTFAVAELSPQQTVDEFLALHGALAAVVPCDDDKREGHAAAGAWLHAAVTTDLAHFSLYSTAAASPTKSSGAASLTVPPASPPPPLAQRPVPSGEADGAEESWLEAARSALGEEMRAWFLGHVERLLDDGVAGTLGQLKRVNDWLDAAVGLGPESAAVKRVRKKIYGYLLDHVESAVVALNGGVAAARRV